jgi:hypothetical protein
MLFTGFAVHHRLVASICLVLALFATSCKKDNSVDANEALVTPFYGISKTDETGTVSEPDSDDWKPLSSIGMSFTTIAHPNPCKPGIGFVLQWRLQAADSVNITINDAPIHALNTLLSKRLVAGQYALTEHLDGYQPAIYRVYFRIVRGDSTYSTYGDVQVRS